MFHLGRFGAAILVLLVTLVAIAAAVATSGGSMFSPGALNAESRGDIRRGGVASHAEIAGNCAACHAAPWSGTSMTGSCLACHDDIGQQIVAHAPMHGRLAEPMECRHCHTEHNGPHGALTNFVQFDHDCAAFPLTGKHRSVDCQSCHVNSVYRGTAKTCTSCHAEPAVHKNRFGTDCRKCHSTDTWAASAVAQGQFDHARTAFPLTGKHQFVNCKSCHTSKVYKGTRQTCVSCHAEPPVHKGRFGTQCSKCHSTRAWAAAGMDLSGFDHGRTAFPLTGKHRLVDCRSCHTSKVYKGTPQTCVSCHAEPTVHKGRFGTDCSKCHTTSIWSGATFAHKFPLNHGRRKANACITCHTTPNDFQKYTCHGCHEHEPARVAKQHSRRNLKDLEKCAVCHPTGRENDARKGRKLVLGLETCPGCPAPCCFGPTGERDLPLRGSDWDEAAVEKLVLLGRAQAKLPTTAHGKTQAPADILLRQMERTDEAFVENPFLGRFPFRSVMISHRILICLGRTDSQ
jgi:hypothetical protein